MEAKHYWGFIHFIEFHYKALNKRDIFCALKDHTGFNGRLLEKNKQVDKKQR